MKELQDQLEAEQYFSVSLYPIIGRPYANYVMSVLDAH